MLPGEQATANGPPTASCKSMSSTSSYDEPQDRPPAASSMDTTLYENSRIKIKAVIEGLKDFKTKLELKKKVLLQVESAIFNDKLRKATQRREAILKAFEAQDSEASVMQKRLEKIAHLVDCAQSASNELQQWRAQIENLVPQVDVMQFSIQVIEEKQFHVRRPQTSINGNFIKKALAFLENSMISILNNLVDVVRLIPFKSGEIYLYGKIEEELSENQAKLTQNHNKMKQAQKNLLKFFFRVFELLKLANVINASIVPPEYFTPGGVKICLQKSTAVLKTYQDYVKSIENVTEEDLQIFIQDYNKGQITAEKISVCSLNVRKIVDKILRTEQTQFEKKSAFFRVLNTHGLPLLLIKEFLKVAGYSFTNQEYAKMLSMKILGERLDTTKFEATLRGFGVPEDEIEHLAGDLEQNVKAFQDALDAISDPIPNGDESFSTERSTNASEA